MGGSGRRPLSGEKSRPSPEAISCSYEKESAMKIVLQACAGKAFVR
jgi:hypothetical protein